MDPFKDAKTNSQVSISSEAAQADNERRLFHLKTLYDVSRELLGVVEIQTILKNFLLMTLGNFGVVEGILFTYNSNSRQANQLVSIGIQEEEKPALLEGVPDFLKNERPANGILSEEERRQLEFLPPSIHCVMRFVVDEGCAGILGLGSKIIEEPFSAEDIDLLETLVNNLIVALKNARSAAALKNAYEELSILNRAKDKLIHHLAHELQTPLAVLKSSLALLKRKLAPLPGKGWQRTIERADRHLQRISEMQIEVEDILKNPVTDSYRIISRLIDQCSDELEVLLAEQIGETHAIERIRQRIDEIYGPREIAPEDIMLDEFVKEKIKQIQPLHSHRQLNLVIDTEETPFLRVPPEALEKLVAGLIKNAVENTPDEGKIEVKVKNRDRAVVFTVHDFGVGLVEEHRKHIFEGFFPTQETDQYSSKKPFDFNAGGKGADLLRLKIFSERYNFKLDVSSSRCRYIPLTRDLCPGKISQCPFCKTVEDCYLSGETIFTALFPSP
jgi:signal transduction histidine kinase